MLLVFMCPFLITLMHHPCPWARARALFARRRHAFTVCMIACLLTCHTYFSMVSFLGLWSVGLFMVTRSPLHDFRRLTNDMCSPDYC